MLVSSGSEMLNLREGLVQRVGCLAVLVSSGSEMLNLREGLVQRVGCLAVLVSVRPKTLILTRASRSALDVSRCWSASDRRRSISERAWFSASDASRSKSALIGSHSMISSIAANYLASDKAP